MGPQPPDLAHKAVCWGPGAVSWASSRWQRRTGLEGGTVSGREGGRAGGQVRGRPPESVRLSGKNNPAWFFPQAGSSP